MTTRTLLFTLALSILGCGGEVDQSAGPGPGPDSSSDTASPPTETGVDGASDVAPDTSTLPDGIGIDVPPPDTGVPISGACKTAGGAVCTEHRWLICPKGYEPIATGDGHLDCGDGWCCVLAPTSTCSSSGKGNCVVGECKGCWSKVADASLTCESGRSCCEDMCD